MRTMNRTVWAWAKLVKFTCQAIYMSNFSYDNFVCDKYTYVKAGMFKNWQPVHLL